MTNKKPKRAKKYQGAEAQSQRDRRNNNNSEPESKYLKKSNKDSFVESQNIFSTPFSSHLPNAFDNSSYINNLYPGSILTTPAVSILSSFSGLQASSLVNTGLAHAISGLGATSLNTGMAHALRSLGGITSNNNLSASLVAASKTSTYAEKSTSSFPWSEIGNQIQISGLQASSLVNTGIAHALSSLGGITANNHLSASLVAASKFSTYAEKSLSSFPWSGIGSQIQISGIDKLRISNSFTDLSNNYSNLLDSFKTTPQLYSDLNSSLTKGIPIEFYTGADLLEAISTEEHTTLGEELAKTEIIYENKYSLSEYLPKVAPGLENMWKGAVETFYGNNSDRIRQFVTSIRELFTHLMHILAPDDEIKKWSNDAIHYHEGRPTRKARLLYICRNISAAPFSSFVDADIKATLQFIDLFQKGTHSIESGFNETQTMSMKIKAETTIRFILEIEFGANRK
jgi:hypothetical protein